MSSDIAIRIEGLGKCYRIEHQERQTTLAEQLLRRARHPLRRRQFEEFWALENVNLELRKGEVLGLIGKNGAGKSTLLKVLSRITPPTTGRVEVHGRLGTLLEVGTGFHPELTGRENVFLNGSILGMRRREIQRKFDEIVDFAGVERFLDTPVKRYSSGMYLRLAFAVAAHLDTDILLLDEVLTVGDADFQDKCFGAITNAASSGRSAVFVSHLMSAVTTVCTTAVHLAAGSVADVGAPADVAQRYLVSRGVASSQSAPSDRGSFEMRITADVVEPHGTIPFELGIHEHLADKWYGVLHVRTASGQRSFSIDTRFNSPWYGPATNTLHITVECPGLAPGTYSAAFEIHDGACLDQCAGVAFDVAPILPYENTVGFDDIEGTPLVPRFFVQTGGNARAPRHVHSLPEEGRARA